MHNIVLSANCTPDPIFDHESCFSFSKIIQAIHPPSDLHRPCQLWGSKITYSASNGPFSGFPLGKHEVMYQLRKHLILRLRSRCSWVLRRGVRRLWVINIACKWCAKLYQRGVYMFLPWLSAAWFRCFPWGGEDFCGRYGLWKSQAVLAPIHPRGNLEG